MVVPRAVIPCGDPVSFVLVSGLAKLRKEHYRCEKRGYGQGGVQYVGRLKTKKGAPWGAPFFTSILCTCREYAITSGRYS